jgi:hypothetical protein
MQRVQQPPQTLPVVWQELFLTNLVQDQHCSQLQVLQVNF